MFFFSPALGRLWAKIFLYKTGVLGFAEGRRKSNPNKKLSVEKMMRVRSYYKQ
jgi:hypothetical protein